MKVLVVYESMFGNTAAVAVAVVHGLGVGEDVELWEVAKAPSADGFDLVVAGAPTHAFSLSHPSTRQDALTRGANQGSVQHGLREWLGGLAQADPGQQFVAFETRTGPTFRVPGSAAAKATRLARGLGFTTLRRQSFFVRGTSGPLFEGELVRADAWGRELRSADTNASRIGRG